MKGGYRNKPLPALGFRPISCTGTRHPPASTTHLPSPITSVRKQIDHVLNIATNLDRREIDRLRHREWSQDRPVQVSNVARTSCKQHVVGNLPVCGALTRV